ncbi:MAG: permease-like cell division protein FtsX, partial [Coriobacteriia bacterium]|nr:permease-like cell division protein FtsX [Coriobacteriia bacterium]
KNPADRPQDAASFRAMLQGASVPAASTIIAPAAPFQQTPSTLKSKKMLPYALVGGVGVLVIALVFVFANSGDTGAGTEVGAQAGVGAEEHVVKSIESEVSLSIFLADEAVDADVTALINFIHSLPGVSNVTYIDKDQALENFKEMTGSGIVEQLEGNPLPASLEIDLADPDQVEAVASAIQSEPVYVKVVDNPANPADSIKYRLQNVGGMGGTGLEDALISVTEVMSQAYATASSQLADDRDPNTNTSFNYNPANVLDGSINTCWCPGSNNAGIGQWVKINLPQEAEVQGFTIYNGMWRLEDRLQQNARVRGVTVSFSDGSSETFILQDPVNGQFASGQPERITFQKPHPTYSVTFTIDSVYPGSRWDDTCIAGIGLF